MTRMGSIAPHFRWLPVRHRTRDRFFCAKIESWDWQCGTRSSTPLKGPQVHRQRTLEVIILNGHLEHIPRASVISAFLSCGTLKVTYGECTHTSRVRARWESWCAGTKIKRFCPSCSHRDSRVMRCCSSEEDEWRWWKRGERVELVEEVVVGWKIWIIPLCASKMVMTMTTKEWEEKSNHDWLLKRLIISGQRRRRPFFTFGRFPDLFGSCGPRTPATMKRMHMRVSYMR